MSPNDPPPAATASHPKGSRRTLVHHGNRRWVLEPGQSVSFGRGSPCDIRIADDPLDEHVSRRAGVLEYHGEHVVVRNESRSQTLIFSPARGPEQRIEPSEAITARQHTEFLVALPGRGGNHHVLQVTTTTPRGAEPRLR
jgi:hypothetical protein